jgi:hypothetical protein
MKFYFQKCDKKYFIQNFKTLFYFLIILLLHLKINKNLEIKHKI